MPRNIQIRMFMVLCALLGLLCCPATAAYSQNLVSQDSSSGQQGTYVDVPSSHWAYEYIENCTRKGLVDGVGDRKFNPDGILSRAESAQILYNAYSKLVGPIREESGRGQDLDPDDWFYDSASWVIDAGIWNFIEMHFMGMDGKVYDGVLFVPEMECSRRDLCGALYIASQRLSIELPVTEEIMDFSDLYPYTPSGISPQEYHPYIYALQQAGIIDGYPNGDFGYADGITRAQVCKILDLFTDIPGLESFDMRAADCIE